MFKSVSKKLIAATITISLLALASLPAQAKDQIRFGWTAWADAEFVTKLAKQTIEDHWDVDVKLPMSAIALQFQGVADGDIDGMLMAWLPDTHADYWDRFEDQVVDLGKLYDHARLGWVVPSYVPKDEVSSIEDLKKPEVKKKFNRTVQGIDPGAGLSRLSKDAIKDYGLDDYHLQTASESAMVSALDRAIKKKQWIVATAWTPHWMFGRWDLRFLDDPKGSLGQAQHINIIVRQGFKEDYPEIAHYLENMYIPIDVLQKYMDIAQQTSYDKAVKKFIEQEHDRISKWMDK